MENIIKSYEDKISNLVKDKFNKDFLIKSFNYF